MSASAIVADVDNLITLPDVYVHINRIVDSPDCTTFEIAKAVSSDPSFSVRLLQVANSSFYRFPAVIDSIDKAVSVIGTSQIRSLSLSMFVVSIFGGLKNDLVSIENFWRHSLRCALAARHLAKVARCCDPEALFTAGLLHDIGKLVIFYRLPVLAKKALQLALDSPEKLEIYEAEKKILGLDHAEVGGELARQWQLPPMLGESITHHHHIEAAQSYPLETALVHIANIAAHMAELDSLDPVNVPNIDPLAWEITGLAPASVEPAMRVAQEEIAEIEKLFLSK